MTEQETLQALSVLQTKYDGLAAQSFTSSMLLEFIVERINMAVAEDNLSVARIDLDDFQPFYEERVKEIQAEWTKALKQKINAGGPTDLGSGTVIDLKE